MGNATGFLSNEVSGRGHCSQFAPGAQSFNTTEIDVTDHGPVTEFVMCVPSRHEPAVSDLLGVQDYVVQAVQVHDVILPPGPPPPPEVRREGLLPEVVLRIDARMVVSGCFAAIELCRLGLDFSVSSLVMRAVFFIFFALTCRRAAAILPDLDPPDEVVPLGRGTPLVVAFSLMIFTIAASSLFDMSVLQTLARPVFSTVVATMLALVV
ncbi:uncharacterized protein [Dermacentor albipictus]|uniref:uncharacterized protein n=1 Tax=Dermacentor albipictus TaxID=60249 RepID=UPI0038FC7737